MKTFHPLGIASSIAITAMVLLTAGCRPESMHGGPGTLTLRVDFTLGNDSLLVGRSAVDAVGNHLRLETFALYLGGIELLTDTGAVRLADAERYDAGANDTWSYIVQPGTYRGFRLNIGVPAAFNTNTDPTIWPNDHPLGVNGSAGMFWSWNTGYIFSKFDGKADTTGGTDFIHPFAFHIGGDNQLVDILYDTPWTVEECSNHSFVLEAEVLDFLVNGNDIIDVREDNITHTGDNPALATRYVNAQRASMTLRKQE